jgi:prepilin-type N-terminal cleavage/methylation domain-containing protein
MPVTTRQAGFTLVELVVAMAVFSMMLLIVVVGFMNIVRLHNAALASNMAQDNARAAMDDMVRAVRDSSGTSTPPTLGPNGTLCLKYTTGPMQYYYTRVVAGVRSLYKSDGCGTIPGANERALTNSYVNVNYFQAQVTSSGATIVKPEIQMTLLVGSSNGTTTNTGLATVCNNNNADRAFCSVVKLTSGATPR